MCDGVEKTGGDKVTDDGPTMAPGSNGLHNGAANIAVRAKAPETNGSGAVLAVCQDPSRRESSGYAVVNRSRVGGASTDGEPGGTGQGGPHSYDQVGGRVTTPKDPSRKESNGYAEVKRTEAGSDDDIDQTKPHEYDLVGGAAPPSADPRRDSSGYTLIDSSKVASGSNYYHNQAREHSESPPRPSHITIAEDGVRGQDGVTEKHSYEKVPGQEGEVVTPTYLEVKQRGSPFTYKPKHTT